MGRNEAAPPDGAEVIYSRVLCCEPRHGLVKVTAGSGAHTHTQFLPLSVAIDLQQRLRTAIEKILSEDNIEELPLDGLRADH